MVNMYLYYSLLFIILVVKEKGAGDLINLLAPSFTCKGRGDLTIERGIYGHWQNIFSIVIIKTESLSLHVFVTTRAYYIHLQYVPWVQSPLPQQKWAETADF